ncbi:hypothetical protein [Enterococcus avium]|uniref:hypothetical protein n=1 Tax=Enterococcus avium TaxID=33945 RepID=UPI00379A82F9
MSMKKHLLIELSLVIVFMGASFWNVRQQQEAVSLRETVVALKEQEKDSKAKRQHLISEKEYLSDEVAATSKALKTAEKKFDRAEANRGLNTEFINVVTKLFKANLNFTPENYDDRKKEVSNYLSEELNKDFFGQKRTTYQNVNGTSSKLESLEIYSKSHQDDEIIGLSVVYHKSKENGQDWSKGMNIFKVTYNKKSKKIVDIINLGSGYSGE